MDDIFETKDAIRKTVIETIAKIPEDERAKKIEQIESRLFSFANFLESKIILFYCQIPSQVPTDRILDLCHDYDKIAVLPACNTEKLKMTLFKVDNIKNDLCKGPRGNREPNQNRCKEVPIECLDLAIIPGLAFDEKGGRLGTGDGYYDRLIPDLAITTRKVALAFEAQLVDQIPMESHDKFVDIIITEDRIIYKI